MGKNNERITDEVLQDYKHRQEERKNLENQWRLNIDFYKGEQNKFISDFSAIVNLERQYFWQAHEVYNHIGALVESRLAVLAEVKPDVNDELVKTIMDKIHFNRLTEQGNFWQEVTGTVFYKVVLSPKEGDINPIGIAVCSPFEIYPDRLDICDMDEIGSVIHAKKVGDKLIIEKWGKERLTIINDGKLKYDGPLPFPFPFVRGTSEIVAGEFFGKSVVERAIPVQRAYNAVKNRRLEFMNRMACGVVVVEDGSVDIDSLEVDGLCPGKIIVYRQGSKEPQFMPAGSMPDSLDKEETKLLAEFVTITGGGDMISELSGRANIGAVSLQLINEQSKIRLRRPIQSIRDVYAEVGKKILAILKIKEN